MSGVPETSAKSADPAHASPMRSMPLLLAALAVLVLLPLLARFGAQAYILSFMTRALIFAIAALSLDLILGYGALVSFGPLPSRTRAAASASRQSASPIFTSCPPISTAQAGHGKSPLIRAAIADAGAEKSIAPSSFPSFRQ